MSPRTPHLCYSFRLSRVSYEVAWRLQKDLVEKRKQQEGQDVLLLLEHPPVYTLGYGASLSFLKFESHSSSYELHRTERGGEVTYHCPGQIVGYPILDLRAYRQDLHWYLRQLEEVLICALLSLGLEGYRLSGLTGVWLNGHKVAAIGIKVSRWITMHGFALNVCPDISGFQHIVPCGIADKPVGSLRQFRADITMNQAYTAIEAAFARVFGVCLDASGGVKTEILPKWFLQGGDYLDWDWNNPSP